MGVPGEFPKTRSAGVERRMSRGIVGRTIAVLICAGAAGYDTDPYTNRHLDIADSLLVLDREVNAALNDLATSWARDEDEWAFVNAVYRRLGGAHWVDRLERWAMKSPEVEKLPTTRRESMIPHFPLHAARVMRVFGFCQLIRIDGVYVGTDKIGHFFSQGRKFYRRYRRSGDEALAARWSVVTEAGVMGRITTGIFSNADLVANYEGHLFYRGLFHDGVVAGKTAMFRWQDGKPVQQRPFSWADHVNAFWDEAINPNDYQRALTPHVERRMLRLCDDYARRPHRYRAPDAKALTVRYRHAGLRPTRLPSLGIFLAQNCR